MSFYVAQHRLPQSEGFQSSKRCHSLKLIGDEIQSKNLAVLEEKSFELWQVSFELRDRHIPTAGINFSSPSSAGEFARCDNLISPHLSFD